MLFCQNIIFIKKYTWEIFGKDQSKSKTEEYMISRYLKEKTYQLLSSKKIIEN